MGDVEALGAPKSQAWAEPRIGSLAKIAITEKVSTELRQWPGSLLWGSMTSGQGRSSLPSAPLVLCSSREEKVQPSPRTLVFHLVLGGGVGAQGDIDTSC